ncbi:hypothetical protein N9963_01365 [Crocinitomicaceae bacterium]|nr:hypothetical protein [Crocinitomicaceae bacterium]
MRIRANISKITPVIITLFLLWGVFYIGRSFLKSPENYNLEYIPNNTDWLLQIDGDKILSDAARSVLIENQDVELISLIEEKLYNSQNSDQLSGGMGIQLNSTIIAFGIFAQEANITAFLVNLNNVDEFLNNENDLLKSAHLSINGARNVGLILFSSKENTDKNEFLVISDAVFSKAISNAGNELTKSLTFQCNTNQFPINKFEFNIRESHFDLSGEFKLQQKIEETKLRLAPKGFSVFTQIIPKKLNDSISSFLGTNSPLVGLSLNYAGATLKSLEKIAFQINTEVLLHFEDSLDFNSIFETLIAQQKIDSLTAHQITVYGVNYYYHVHDHNTLYFGLDTFDSSNLISDDRLISINGEPSNLTKVKGDGIAHKLLGLVSIYSASKNLSGSINLIELEAIYGSKDIVIFNGNIAFKKNKATYNELLRFLINSDLFE